MHNYVYTKIIGPLTAKSLREIMLGAVIVGLLGIKYHLHCLYKGVSIFINVFLVDFIVSNSKYDCNIIQLN